MNVLYLLAAILLLGILVTVHEFGHFISARLLGIEVVEFAIGFGPKLFSRVGKKHGTRFSLRAIPLGGYCAFYGEDDADGTHQDDPRAYAKQPVWKRMISVLMGPGMNFLLAFVVLLGWYWADGLPVYDPAIVTVEAGSPAEAAGLQSGDLLLTVDGAPVDDLEAFTQAIAGWQAGQEPLTLTVDREGTEETLRLAPFYDEELSRYRLGVQIGLRWRQTADGSYITRPITLWEAARLSGEGCVTAGGTIIGALRRLVTTGEGLEDTSGPVGVVSLVYQEVSTGGLQAFLNLLVVISINLGIMNLLPIPGLDGSRFLFMLLEAIRRKPIPPQKEAMVHLAGMVFLFAVMIWFTFRDVGRLIG